MMTKKRTMDEACCPWCGCEGRLRDFTGPKIFLDATVIKRRKKLGQHKDFRPDLAAERQETETPKRPMPKAIIKWEWVGWGAGLKHKRRVVLRSDAEAMIRAAEEMAHLWEGAEEELRNKSNADHWKKDVLIDKLRMKIERMTRAKRK